MYIYVEKSKGLDEVPDQLKSLFKEFIHVVDFLLSPDKKLAREDAEKVLNNMKEQGYHLQMPPKQENFLAEYLAGQQTEGATK